MTSLHELQRAKQLQIQNMIQEPLFILIILFGVTFAAQKMPLQLSRTPVLKFLPSPIWCYLLPILLTSFGFIPENAPVYDLISKHALPAALLLLLLVTNLKELKRPGKAALFAMGCATVSVVLAGVISFFVYKKQVGVETWKAIGTLTASWTGGTINMLSVKQATGLSDGLFSPLFITDLTVVYIWMTILIALSTKQTKIDRLLRAKPIHLEMTEQSAAHQTLDAPKKNSRMSTPSLFTLLLLGFGLGGAAEWISTKIPPVVAGFSAATWAIVLITTLGLFLSSQRYARKESANALKVGYFLLYLVLAATGAKTKLSAVLNAPILLSMGLFWAAVHACILFALGWTFKIPSALLATASQANLGGVASAPLVASSYDAKLVPTGLILALLGNAFGNYAGILTAQFLSRF